MPCIRCIPYINARGLGFFSLQNEEKIPMVICRMIFEDFHL